MAAAMHLVAGGNYHAYLVGFAVFSLALQVFIPFPRYAPLLKLMTLSLLAYVGAVLFVEVNWGVVLRRAVWPSFTWSREYLLTLVAVLGTTISPYLFFWQAGQEVEELRSIPSNAPLRDSPDGARAQLRRIKIDTYLGMAFSNLVALFIMITTAATLNTAGITDIQTTQQAAEALRPLAGEYAFLLFTLGVVGTGLLAVPILAGSAAYAVSEAFGWRASLSERPLTATGFYGVMIAATLVGVALTFNDVDPIRELFWSAVLNGVIAVPIMAVMMRLAVRADVMGSFVITRRLKFLGWLCTGVMATAVIATIVSSVT